MFCEFHCESETTETTKTSRATKTSTLGWNYDENYKVDDKSDGSEGDDDNYGSDDDGYATERTPRSVSFSYEERN